MKDPMALGKDLEIDMTDYDVDSYISTLMEKAKYYREKAHDEICDTTCPARCGSTCALVASRYLELLEENTCPHCGRLLGPNDDRFTVATCAGVESYCSREAAEESLL